MKWDPLDLAIVILVSTLPLLVIFGIVATICE
jgi:hypothetical protein